MLVSGYVLRMCTLVASEGRGPGTRSGDHLSQSSSSDFQGSGRPETSLLRTTPPTN